MRTEIHTQMYEAVRRRQAAADEESYECFVGMLLQAGIPEGEEEFYSYAPTIQF